MTVLEWLKKKTRYSFTEGNFEVIALDRGVQPMDDVYGANVTKRIRDLMEADIIFTAVLLSPSNTASLSQSHNGYQKTIGQEQDFYQNDKIKYAIGIYQKYGDDKADILMNMQKKIRFIPIEDVDSL
jgi:dissimilatory sulfite reductase (desulfoviridin) alpha/beta subunit